MERIRQVPKEMQDKIAKRNIKEQEVVSIMIALYDYENSLNKKIKFERMDAKEEQARESAQNMFHDGVKIEKIAQYLNCAVDTVKKWVGIATA